MVASDMVLMLCDDDGARMISAAEFIAANIDGLDAGEGWAIGFEMALAGGCYHGGGGAAAWWTLHRPVTGPGYAVAWKLADGEQGERKRLTMAGALGEVGYHLNRGRAVWLEYSWGGGIGGTPERLGSWNESL